MNTMVWWTSVQLLLKSQAETIAIYLLVYTCFHQHLFQFPSPSFLITLI
jgi:hypothetical protein